MKSTSTITALSLCAAAALLWGVVLWFNIEIDARAAAAADAISKGQQSSLRRNADSASLALAVATEEGRAQLVSFVNKDALALSNVIAAAGRDAGVELTIGNVTQGPGPALPKGNTLRPTSITFSLHAVGSFQNLFTLVALLSDLHAASSIDRLQLVRGSDAEGWVLNADVRVITSSPL